MGEASDKSEQQLQELQAHIAHLREHLERLQIRKHLPSREQDVPALLLQPIDVAAKNRRLETLRRLHEQDVDQLRFLKSLRMLVEENVKVIGAQLSQCVVRHLFACACHSVCVCVSMSVSMRARVYIFHRTTALGARHQATHRKTLLFFADPGWRS